MRTREDAIAMAGQLEKAFAISISLVAKMKAYRKELDWQWLKAAEAVELEKLRRGRDDE